MLLVVVVVAVFFWLQVEIFWLDPPAGTLKQIPQRESQSESVDLFVRPPEVINLPATIHASYDLRDMRSETAHTG